MATKNELKTQIIKLYTEYLGFSVEGVAGLSTLSKEQLQDEVKGINRALRFKRYAKKINSDPILGYFASPESYTGIQFRRRQIVEAMANELWKKVSYNEAKSKVRSKFS